MLLLLSLLPLPLLLLLLLVLPRPSLVSKNSHMYVCIYWSVCMCACACLWRGEHVRTCTCIWLYVCVVRNQQGWRQTSCCVPPLHVTCCCCCCCCCIVVVVGGYVFAWFDHFSAAAEQSSSVGSRRPCAYFWLTIATVCTSASERVRRVCANIATVCDVDVALLPISLSLLLPLSFPDALNYLIIVRFFFCSFWLSLSLKHVFVCVCMRACVRVCFCFRAALSPVSRVASSFSFAHTHSTHWFVWFLLLLLCVLYFCCCCLCHLGTLLWSLNEFFSLPRLVVFNCFMRSLAARRSALVVPCVVASAF